MGFANYTELQASVISWLARPDLTAKVPDYILFAEAQFNRTLRTRLQIRRGTIDVDQEYKTLPNDFEEFISGYLNSTPRAALSYLPNDTATDSYCTSGIPTHFSIEGDSFRFSPAPISAHTATIQYFAKVPPLALNATNWLLTAHPDAYLYGSVLQAEVDIKDDPRLPLMKQGYDIIVGQIMAQANRSRWGGNGMVMRAA